MSQPAGRCGREDGAMGEYKRSRRLPGHSVSMRVLSILLLLSGVAFVAVAAPKSTSSVVEGEEKEETANRSGCPLPFISIGGRCIFVNSLEEGTWAQVENLCVMLHGHLVKIDSGLFLSEIVQYITDSGLQGNFWTGGTDVDNEGDWTWQDGTPVHMGTPFWGYYPEEPVVQHPTHNNAANCLCIRDYLLYFFMECSCSDAYSPICEFDVEDVTTTRLLIPTTSDWRTSSGMRSL